MSSITQTAKTVRALQVKVSDLYESINYLRDEIDMVTEDAGFTDEEIERELARLDAEDDERHTEMLMLHGCEG